MNLGAIYSLSFIQFIYFCPGSIIRTVAFFNIDGLIVETQESAPLNPLVSKASSGALETYSKIFKTRNLKQLLAVSIEDKYHILGAMSSENPHKIQIPSHELTLRSPTILVLGSENRGIRPSIQQLCQSFTKIPGSTIDLKLLDSLNVNVAAGILLHQLKSHK
jgi:21S rRNA (GM2251-2'-O)-methyltransferase